MDNVTGDRLQSRATQIGLGPANHIRHLGVPLDRDIGRDSALGEETPLGAIGQTLAVSRRKKAGDIGSGHQRSRGWKRRAAVVLRHELLIGRAIVPLQKRAPKVVAHKGWFPSVLENRHHPAQRQQGAHQGRFARARLSQADSALPVVEHNGNTQVIAGGPDPVQGGLALQGEGCAGGQTAHARAAIEEQAQAVGEPR